MACYNEVELEAPFQYPQFARFVPYDEADKVISRIFHPTVGGISTAVGQTLVEESNYSLLRNPIPAVYKFIDFYQVYTALCSYLVNLFEQNFTMNDAPGYVPDTLPCTQQEFMTMLRQALLTQYPSQVHAQFVAPQTGQPSQAVSIFEPFIVDSVLSPSNVYQSLLIPQFMQETLNMLKPCSTQVQRTPNSDKYKQPPKKLRHNFYPVWGVYSGDVPPTFSFRYNGETKPLFQPDDPANTWRLWDGMSSNNTIVKYNFNAERFTRVVTLWNDILTRNQNKSSTISPISGDSGPGVSLLMYTRVLEAINPTLASAPRNKYSSPLYDNIVNKPRGDIRTEKLERTESKKGKNAKPDKVDTIPPASYFDLYTQNILSHTPLAMDYFGSIRYFILPEIRVDTEGTDPVTLAAYSVYTGEVCCVSNTYGTAPSDNEVARLSIIGQMMTSGAFAADPNNNALTNAVAELAKQGEGSDLIKSILGGMASLIPGVGGVISNVIQGL